MRNKCKASGEYQNAFTPAHQRWEMVGGGRVACPDCGRHVKVRWNPNESDGRSLPSHSAQQKCA